MSEYKALFPFPNMPPHCFVKTEEEEEGETRAFVANVVLLVVAAIRNPYSSEPNPCFYVYVEAMLKTYFFQSL